MHPRASFVLASLGLSLLAQAQDRTPTQPAQQLIADVIYNELQDRGCDSFWQYRSFRVSGSQDVVREQVETSDGPIFRVIEDHGNPLDSAERRREDLRLQELVEKPGAMARTRQEHLQDDERMRKVVEMLPQAFLFEYAGPSEGDRVRLSFRPNPAFTPNSYEARIVHALGGTLVVNQKLKRMVDMDGRLVDRVDFGYGILGHVEKGGTFEIHREQVSEVHWKTNLVAVHIRGKVLLFKNVSKDQRESRSDFRPVPHDISLVAAKELLDQAASGRTEARLVSGKR
ncbi:MAG TPA: hypothetical protein VHT28_11845 [Silvibacterium sp.]|nr:hypothetical protein [Silvibacterium sp.]